MGLGASGEGFTGFVGAFFGAGFGIRTRRPAPAWNPPTFTERLVAWDGAARVTALAVLLFENLSRDAKQDYLASGISGELTYDLSLIGTVRVVAGTPRARYKQGAKTSRRRPRDSRLAPS